MSYNVTTDQRWGSPLRSSSTRRRPPINVNTSRPTPSYSTKNKRYFMPSRMGNGLVNPTVNGTSEGRALPPGPGGPLGPRGEVMSCHALPLKRDVISSTPPVISAGDGGRITTVMYRTGSHSDVRTGSPPSFVKGGAASSCNGRAPSASKATTSSLGRSKRLATSNSTINSVSSEPSAPSRTSALNSDSSERSLSRKLSELRVISPENNGSNSEPFEALERQSSGSRSNGSLSSYVGDPMDKRGLVGLKNLGNTCFMNSVLQCLSHSRPLLEYCLQRNYDRDLNTTTSSMQGSLFKAYADLMQQMWASSPSSTYISPTQFKSRIQRFAPRFMGYSQQDAQEFLRYLLQGLHEDVNRVKSKEKPIIPNYEKEDKIPDKEKSKIYWDRLRRLENSKLQDMFTGQLKSTLKCDDCGYCSTTFDPFWDLSLPIPKRNPSGSGQTLVDCIKLFTTKEILDGDEKPTCARCKARRRCTKYFTIQSFPKLLVLHLKRFSGERSRSKIQSRIDYPLKGLDLSKFCADSCLQSHPIYNLYAVSCHSGSVHSGHYTAYVKHAYNGHWYDYDDTRVSSPLPSQTVICAEGYVLFYELEHNS